MEELILAGKPESLTDIVFSSILDAIVARVLRPGARITEAAVAKQLRVSKTPVREALLRLREVGLVEPNGSRGSQIVRPSAEKLRQAYELREVLEAATAAIASTRGDPAAISQISQAADEGLEAARAGRSNEFWARDRRFHLSIARAAGNQRIERAIDDAMVLIVALRQRDVPDLHDAIRCAEVHGAIAAAISARDADKAAGQMTSHIRDVERSMFAHWPSSVANRPAAGPTPTSPPVAPLTSDHRDDADASPSADEPRIPMPGRPDSTSAEFADATGR